MKRAEGRCFTDEVLALKLRGKNVNEVLSLSVQEALEYFVEKRCWRCCARCRTWDSVISRWGCG